MPVTYPVVPGGEIPVRDRIIQKHVQYVAVRDGLNPDPVQLQGERYEIAVVEMLYRRGRFTNGNQISRWHVGGAAQNVNVGDNTEYDFVLPVILNMPAVAGVILGEAKSYTHGLGPYIKKALGFCLNDPTIGGFAFVTPGNDYQLFLQMLGTIIPLLAGREDTPGIAGGNHWRNEVARNGKPSGADIVQYFNDKYYNHAQHDALTAQNIVEVLQNQHAGDHTGYVKHTLNPHTGLPRASLYQRRDNRQATALYFNTELAQRAGIIIACYKVLNTNDVALQQLINAL